MRSIHTTTNICWATALLVALTVASPLAQAPTPQVTAPSGTPQEGIKVHGDWTLTVRNADGTVAAVHEFKNALSTSTGADSLLARLLGGDLVSGKWSIGMGMNPPGGCGVGPNCLIGETGHPGAHSLDLAKTLPLTGPDAGKLVLRGSVRMVNATSISVVTTSLGTCQSPTAPAACVAWSGQEFTRKLLTSLVALAPDQMLEVKVVLSFS